MYRVKGGEKKRSDGWEYSWEYPDLDEHPELDRDRAYLLVMLASRRGTELVSPVAGSAPGNSHEGEGDGPPPLTAADFQIDVTGEQATACPAGPPRPSRSTS